ncbi:hypothetical protein [Sphingomonas sp. Leaf10]|uniref:hypothetical protein n=1 Tax=Sphingomonas sp. Leaf10 TaxID=1735676 RepID=UPI0012E2E6D0|nr:hypothetical protein [Sphingomonas sp. Leaf10]
MPRNTGTPPPHERVDLRLENGWVCRNRDPSKYDWRLGSQCIGMPIASWQPVKQ